MKLRISPTGSIQGLWSDRTDWHAIGQLTVRRASYVGFHELIQKWVVRAWRPRGRVRQAMQRLTGRPSGEVLYMSDTRTDALAWEQAWEKEADPSGRAIDAHEAAYSKNVKR